MTPEAFVYCWTDHRDMKLYVGAHKGNHDDEYISSSVYFNKEYHSRKQDFTRMIIADCETFKEALIFENAILKSENAKTNPIYYNKSNGFNDFHSNEFSEETRKKMSLAKKGFTPWNKGKKWSIEQLKNRFGQKRSKESCKKNSEAQLALKKKMSPEHREKLTAAVSGKKQSKEHIQKRLATRALNGYFSDETISNFRSQRNDPEYRRMLSEAVKANLPSKEERSKRAFKIAKNKKKRALIKKFRERIL